MNLNYYLYLLPFKDKKYFKIGISKNNFNRVYTHNRNYNIDFNKSLIITSVKKSAISILEKELLTIFEPVDIEKFKNVDGYTEIRNIKYFNECLSIIKTKHPNLGLKIIKFNKFNKNKPKKIHKIKQSLNIVEIKYNIEINEKKIKEFRDYFFNFYDKYKNNIINIENKYKDNFIINFDLIFDKNLFNNLFNNLRLILNFKASERILDYGLNSITKPGIEISHIGLNLNNTNMINHYEENINLLNETFNNIKDILKKDKNYEKLNKK